MVGVAMLLLLLLLLLVVHLAAGDYSTNRDGPSSLLLQHVVAIAPLKPGSVSDVLHPEQWTHLNYSTSNAIGVSPSRLRVNMSPSSAMLLTIYLKAVCVEDSSRKAEAPAAADICYKYDIKGFASAEQINFPPYNYFQLPRPPNFNQFSRNVTVESPLTRRIIQLATDVPSESQANMVLGPTRITLTKAEAQQGSGLEVRVADDTFYGHQQLDPYKKYKTTIKGTFVTTASDKTTVVVVLPVPHNLRADIVIALLLEHMARHFILGIHQYVMYIQQYVNDYAHDERVQVLVRAGRLALVSFDDMPAHEQQRYSPRILDLYAGQIAVINHAFTALYGDDVIALKMDLDEYLLTPVPGQGAIKTWRECAKRRLSTDNAPGQSSLCLSRHDAFLNPRWQRRAQRLYKARLRAHRKLLGKAMLPGSGLVSRADYHLWQDFAEMSPEQRAVEYPGITHPIQFYDMAEHLDRLMNYKTMDDPGAILGGHVHWTYPNKQLDMLQWDADPGCARVAHVWNLNGHRRDGAGKEPIEGSKWDWPASQEAAVVP